MSPDLDTQVIVKAYMCRKHLCEAIGSWQEL